MHATSSSDIGTVIAALAIFLGYSYFASFYRASARELKRIGEDILVI